MFRKIGKFWYLIVGHYGINIFLDIVDLRTGDTIWFPGINRWYQEVNRNV